MQTAFNRMSPDEQKIVRQCFHATLTFIDRDEIQTRLGIEPEELQRQIDLWPDIDDSSESNTGFLAVNNSLNEVCNGFRIPPEEWSCWFDVPFEAVLETYRKWLSRGGSRGGIR